MARKEINVITGEVIPEMLPKELRKEFEEKASK